MLPATEIWLQWLLLSWRVVCLSSQAVASGSQLPSAILFQYGVINEQSTRKKEREEEEEEKKKKERKKERMNDLFHRDCDSSSAGPFLTFSVFCFQVLFTKEKKKRKRKEKERGKV